ncbi:MAG TPA: FAD-dependent thymidylate synthase [Thermoanaerobaculia bacterium]|nr:FAD-dependent thymidylate synthase [Thermoanaerobaculia bacterium]
MSALPQTASNFSFSSPRPSVRLVHAFERPFENVVATARTCYSSKGIVTEDQASAKPERRDALARSIYEAGHHTTFQHAHFQFAIENVSRHFLWSFLHSHPFYNSEQVSQRYVEVKAGNSAVPPMLPAERELFEATARKQEAAYRRLTELLVPIAGERYFGLFPGRRRDARGEKWSGAIQKRAQEIARYVLPVATFAYLYHTVSGVTLFRYWRLCETYDAPVEQREVVSQMVAEVLRHDPLYASVLQDPIPLEESPEYAAFQALPRARSSDRAFRDEFDRELDGRVSRLVDWKANNEEILASSVREVLGVPRAALSDSDAIAMALDPSRNRTLGETLTLTTHGKLSRALFHPSYTFRKKLSHTADSQDQRHRMTPGSRPARPGYLSEDPDYVVPMLLPEVPEALELYDRTMRETWEAIGQLRSRGVSDEFAAYLLPNAVAIRFTESADLLNLHHKFAMRLCYNAQEEIWRASLDEALQIREVNPRIGPWLLPPCTLRHHAGARPVCPEGDRFCGVVVWRMDATQYQRSL